MRCFYREIEPVSLDTVEKKGCGHCHMGGRESKSYFCLEISWVYDLAALFFTSS